MTPKTPAPNPEIPKSYESCSSQKTTGNYMQTGKVNSIDNQLVNRQNP